MKVTDRWTMLYVHSSEINTSYNNDAPSAVLAVIHSKKSKFGVFISPDEVALVCLKFILSCLKLILSFIKFCSLVTELWLICGF